MKKLRLILPILFSLLIIVSGAGVSIAHYCCAGCETEQSCCTTGCAHCQDTQDASKHSCQDTGCTTVHYKVDLVKYAPDGVSVTPGVTLICAELPQLCSSLLAYFDEKIVPSSAPPLFVSSRHYLALYSILLI